MKKVNYIQIINKYIKPDSPLYQLYIIHAVLVTAKAIKIGRKLKLSKEKLRFIEEASMLHDIGIVNVKSKELGCHGKAPYVCHSLEGEKILKSEGLPKHALIARSHIGVGIKAEEIKKKKLPLPQQDITPKTMEEKIISYADLFYSKSPERLWNQKKPDEVRKVLRKWGKDKVKVFNQWHKLFKE